MEDHPVTMPAPRWGLTRLLPERACLPLAMFVVFGTALLHLAYLAWFCPLDLAPDEAHYWDWSRHIDWSYYSKGPLVAWLIRASCALVGAWSEQHTGGLTFAVRLPAVFCGSMVVLGLYQLAVQVFAKPRIALALVVICLTLPVIAAGRSLMTIDSPYTCCWAWALVFAHRAVTGRSSWAWEATGLMVGLGILAKYTMVVFVPSLALFLLTSREHRRLLWSPGFWSMLGITALACLPILVWNAQHDWVTVRHVARLAGLTPTGESALRGGISTLRWSGPFAYVGAQAGLLLGFWFVLWCWAMWEHNPWRQSDAGVRYLWWLSLPMFVVFLGFSPKTGGGEPNWPVTAYLSGGVLAAGWLAGKLASSSAGFRWGTGAGIVLTCVLGAGLTAFLYQSEMIHPLIERITGPVTEARPFPVRQFDPTCRLRGWRTLAAEVDRLRQELSARGEEPVLAGNGWNVPGELGVYCAGHPPVYSIGLMQGDRHSQYDFWTNPIDQPEKFKGRTFLVVGGILEPVRVAFDNVEPAIRITHLTGGRPIAGWVVHVCRGFKGFAKKPEANH
jgi:4-amino-4-deoxy-L-arabinose transferase-like glycosyltransferase